MEITGILKTKSEIKTFANDFKVQGFYLDCQKFNQETGEPIENLLKIQVTGNRVSLLESLKKGDRVNIFFNIKGRLVEKKDGTGKIHVQNIEAWKIEKVNQENQPSLQTPPKPKPTPTQAPIPPDEDDDLPF